MLLATAALALLVLVVVTSVRAARRRLRYAALLVDAAGRVRATPNWPGTRPAAQTRAG